MKERDRLGPVDLVRLLSLSVVILAWKETTHTTTSVSDTLVAYYFLALPLAAWLVGRRVVSRPAPAAEPEAEAAPST